MKGFVPTPPAVVDDMVQRLFDGVAITHDTRLLDPGCGEGAFIEGVLRHCAANNLPIPHIVGIELHPARAAAARARFVGQRQVRIQEADFLLNPPGSPFDLIIGNPPYVSITHLDPDEKAAYRSMFEAATGRFDLYSLFFEQSLRLLKPTGRLVFITPEKYTYVGSTERLRSMLRDRGVSDLIFADEATFGELVTYPLITVLGGRTLGTLTRVIRRDGSEDAVLLPTSGSWSGTIAGAPEAAAGLTLVDVSLRISCGVATGADGVFVLDANRVPSELLPFAHPTLAGREILPSGVVRPRNVMLAPYDEDGVLLPEDQLGALGAYLGDTERAGRLKARTCAQRKPWYAFHDNFPIRDMLRPKLLCKDITERPFFVVDATGTIVPRHSVYYVVPAADVDLQELAEHLNSQDAATWLRNHLQRAANGFVRMQSQVLKKLPIPASVTCSHHSVDTPTRITA